jgi:hypothetical protein
MKIESKSLNNKDLSAIKHSVTEHNATKKKRVFEAKMIS